MLSREARKICRWIFSALQTQRGSLRAARISLAMPAGVRCGAVTHGVNYAHLLAVMQKYRHLARGFFAAFAAFRRISAGTLVSVPCQLTRKLTT